MKEQTNMEGVKEIARTLLYMPIRKTPLSPIIVQHPFTSTGFTILEGQTHPVNILESNENLRLWQEQLRKEINRAKDVFRIDALLNNPYRLTFLKFAKQEMSREDFSSLLSSAWIRSENPNQDTNVSKAQLVEMFKAADKTVLMDEEDREVLDELENKVTIYRGVTSYNGKNVKALSWTLSEEKAEWFATRFDEEGTVYKAEIDKTHILAYFSGRGEAEVVVEPKYLENIQEWKNPTLQLELTR